MNVFFDQGYSSAQAERGKFAVLDMSTLSNYPSAGDGRYAILTYNVGASPATPTVSGSPAVTNNVAINQSLTLEAGSLSAIDFGVPVNYIEVYNNDQRIGLPLTYLSLTDPSDYSTLETRGIVINKTAFYTVNFETQTIWIGASGSGNVDLRIVGHRAV